MGATTTEERLTSSLAGATIPRHLAVIPDGNRRWALQQGRSLTEGHRAGFEVAKRLSKFCRRIGIHTTTVWAFSTENWRRTAAEVAALFALFEEWIHDLMPEAIREEVRVIHVGRLEGLPDESESAAAAAGYPEGLPSSLKDALQDIQARTKDFNRNVVNLAINYGGADEIKRSVARLIAHIQRTGVDPNSVDLASFLDTAGQPHPNPDIVWRTSGEIRSSGFLPIQSAYSELVFTQKLFPDLTEQDVVETILEYSARIRRFGG
ncbi:MAG: polyprenyl diphosphate synthase [Actinomycetota bacterium]|nr:polyprenyl diphosphate synthase [Actinomycetota bacterium]